MSPEAFSGEFREPLKSDFDAIFVFGSGVSKKAGRFEPSWEGKMRVIAGLEALAQELTDTLVFVGGKVAGPAFPSEARVMRSYALRLSPQSSNRFKVLESPKSTSTSVIDAKNLAQAEGWSQIGIITNSGHLERVKKLAQNLAFEAQGLEAEALLLQRGLAYSPLLEKYRLSQDLRKRETREKLLNFILYLDPRGKIANFVSSRIRG